MPWRKNSRLGIRKLAISQLCDVRQVVFPRWAHFSICEVLSGSNRLMVKDSWQVHCERKDLPRTPWARRCGSAQRVPAGQTHSPCLPPPCASDSGPFGASFLWIQVAGALAEAGAGLKEITERVNVVAKAMGEWQPRGREAGREEGAALGLGAFPATAGEGLPSCSSGLRGLLGEAGAPVALGPRARFLFHRRRRGCPA